MDTAWIDRISGGFSAAAWAWASICDLRIISFISVVKDIDLSIEAALSFPFLSLSLADSMVKSTVKEGARAFDLDGGLQFAARTIGFLLSSGRWSLLAISIAYLICFHLGLVQVWALES